MSKVIITKKEIEDFSHNFIYLMYELSTYKEEEYKEVYVSNSGILYIYDIYSKNWFVKKNLYKLSCLSGFYNYKDIERLICACYSLNKSKSYKVNNNVRKSSYTEIISRTAIRKHLKERDYYLVYNKELEVWEYIIIDCNHSMERRIVLKYHELKELEEISKKELDKELLICELTT